MGRIDKLASMVSKVLAVCAGLCTMGVMVVIAYDVVVRNTTGGSAKGAYEIVGALMVLIAFLGLGYAAREDANVRVSLFTARMPERVGVAARGVGEVVALGLIVWFALASWEAVVVSRDRGEFTQGLVNFTVWPLRGAIALGFSFLAVEQVLVLWRLRLDGRPPALEGVVG